MARSLFTIVLWGLLITTGCDDPARIGAGGLVVEALPAQVEPDRREAEPRNWRGNGEDAGGQDLRGPARNGWGQNRRLPSNSEDWGDAREMPGESQPSDRQVTGRDRQMPSDAMPSRTEKWGRERELPSDRPNWGKDRKMPSDSAFQPRRDDEPASAESADSE